MFKNKKILFICKEASVPVIYFLLKKLSIDNEIGAYFITPTECCFNECIYNTNTFYLLKQQPDVKVFDIRKECEVFYSNFTSPEIDWDYIKLLEKNFTHYKCLNLQLFAGQMHTSRCHYRFYMNDTTYEQNVYWLELFYKRTLQVIKEFQPDMILDLEDAESQRAMINEIAYYLKVPYITMDYPRVDTYKIPTFSLGMENNKELLELYNENMNKPREQLQQEYKYILDFRKKSKIMAEQFIGDITSKYHPDSFFTAAKKYIGILNYFINQDIVAKNLFWKTKKCILFPRTLRYLKFYLLCEIKRQLLYRKNKYFENPVEGETYVYMPLHLIPESTTFARAPFYVDEYHLAEQAAKSLPVGWKLYVKEHQAMLGERSFTFYKKLAKIPNVRVVQPNYYLDPKPWIEHCAGVITITGTSAYEAALLGKKAIVFGNVPSNLIDGIQQLKRFTDLPDMLKELSQIDNIHSCASYINAVKKTGIPININYLYQTSEKLIKNGGETPLKFEKELGNLLRFYEKAYNCWNRG